MSIEIDADDAEIRQIVPVLTSLREACDDLGVEFFVIGALARDLHLQHQNNIDVPRRTRDVDVAVAADGWESYAALRDRLITDQDFTDEDPKQKVHSPEGIELDLVPFGGIEDSSGQIHFPPDDRPEMTVLGFEEARRTTVSVTFDDGVSVEVVSLPALGLLKLIAWDESPTSEPTTLRTSVSFSASISTSGSTPSWKGTRTSSTKTISTAPSSQHKPTDERSLPFFRRGMHFESTSFVSWSGRLPTFIRVV